MKNIHPTAIVHPDTILGDDVTIGPYAIIGQYVSIGAGTEVMAHAIIDGRTTIGKNNKIYPSASVGLPCQDLKYRGEPTKLIIGDNNHIREFATLHLSATLDEDTVVGSNCLFMAYSHVAHNCQIGSNVILANAVNLAGHVHVQDFVVVGGMTAVLQFIKIGAHAFVGGASAIGKDIPPYTRGQGSRRYLIAGLNSVGLMRRGYTTDQVENIKKIYRVFYHEKLNPTQALEYIAEKFTELTPEQQIFVDFVKNSTRGISRNHE
jgi:UDP-N-acetylglucosamine acyltransferase